MKNGYLCYKVCPYQACMSDTYLFKVTPMSAYRVRVGIGVCIINVKDYYQNSQGYFYECISNAKLE